MSWIQDNKFVAGLGGATLVGILAIGYFGISQRSKYAAELEKYQADDAIVQEHTALALYPDEDKVAAKHKNLNTYRKDIAALAASFDKGNYRPKELPAVSPQDFANQAKAATAEVEKAFGKATKLPPGFFLGFETYTGTLARGEASSVLAYELGGAKELFLALAKAGPSELINVFRVKLPEEEGAKWTPAEAQTSRSFPLEVTFKGSEAAARKFISAIANSPNYYFTTSVLRIVNTKSDKAPAKADAVFEARTPGGAGATGGASDPFGGGFQLPEPTQPAPGAPAPAASDTAAKTDTSRILQQVLGAEEVYVFVRVDIVRFLPTKELPAVPN